MVKRSKIPAHKLKRTYCYVPLLLILSLSILLSGGTGDSSNQDTQIEIGISWMEPIDSGEYSEDLQAYIDAVELVGAVPVVLPLFTRADQARLAVHSIDALIMTGGEDIDPSYYGEKPSEYLEEVNQARDKSDIMLLNAALERDIPVLAICRGMQLLNVATGGSLLQDIPAAIGNTVEHRDSKQEDFAMHDLYIYENNILDDLLGTDGYNVNSWHHLGIKELGKGLKVVAKAEDGIIEAVVKTDQTFVLGVQFHPEWMLDEADIVSIFQTLVEQAEQQTLAPAA